MENEHAVLIERVTEGFGALMEQVQALAARNDAQGQRLSQLNAEVRWRLPIQQKTAHFPMMRTHSSRSELHTSDDRDHKIKNLTRHPRSCPSCFLPIALL